MATKPKRAAAVPTSQPAAAAPQPASSTAKKPGVFTRLANFLLSRLPWFRDRYETWTNGRKILVAFFLYLIVLPVIPIIIAIVMYVHDPEGFKKSKAFPILMAIIVAQLGAFGIISTQQPKVTQDVQSTTATSTATDNNDKAVKATPADGSTPAPGAATNGKYFKNCAAAFSAGANNIPKSDPSYRKELDADGDGIACEK